MSCGCCKRVWVDAVCKHQQTGAGVTDSRLKRGFVLDLLGRKTGADAGPADLDEAAHSLTDQRPAQARRRDPPAASSAVTASASVAGVGTVLAGVML